LKEWTMNAVNGSSRILIGESLDNLAAYLPPGRNVIVTDSKVRRLYGRRFPDLETIEIGRGEAIKTLRTTESLYKRFIELRLDRESFITAIGGGIVCDVAGFAAASFMRGLDFGAVPTTLLSQADAGLGGKTGINFQGYKNLIGAFRQPRFVLFDPGLLQTLPKTEIICGLAEIVKHAAIRSAGLFDFLETNHERLLLLEPSPILRVVEESVGIKSAIVQADALESGERRLLNFGHTLGHAVEKTSGRPHGEAVGIGMVMAAEISRRRHRLTDPDFGRLVGLLRNLGLPTELPSRSGPIEKAVRADKKRAGDKLHFVLLREIGQAETVEMSFDELGEHIHDLCQRG